MLQAVLSVANEEQSMFYSPRVFTDQYNVVTSMLISALVKAYPMNPVVIDQLEPFVRVKLIPVINGFVDLPDDYRDILGTPYIYANESLNGECGEKVEEPLTASSFKVQNLKGKCNMSAVTIYPESEFALRTRSTYDSPTWEKPIGFFSGAKQIKVCPYDIGKVALMYVVKEKAYVYGYIPQPDDTFLPDPATTVESEWNSNAFDPIFKAMISMYSAYAKDQEIQNWSQLLSERGIL